MEEKSNTENAPVGPGADERMPKKAVAQEIYNVRMILNTVSLILIICGLVVGIMGAFGKWYGAIGAGAFAIIGGYYFVRNKKEMDYLKFTYGAR